MVSLVVRIRYNLIISCPYQIDIDKLYHAAASSKTEHHIAVIVNDSFYRTKCCLNTRAMGNKICYSSPPRQNGGDNLRCIFANETFRILLKISLKSFPTGPIYNNPALACSDNDLVPNRRQAIIWTKPHPIHWRTGGGYLNGSIDTLWKKNTISTFYSYIYINITLKHCPDGVRQGVHLTPIT